MAMYAINYDGLRKRDTYNELIDYLQFGQEKIIYPDRFAKRLRESPQISNLLDGEGLGKGDLEEQEKKHIKELLKEFAIREAGGTAQISRAGSNNNPSRASDTTSVVSDYDEDVLDLGDRLANLFLDENRNQQNINQNLVQHNQNHLNNVHEQNNGFLLGGHTLIQNQPKAPAHPYPAPMQPVPPLPPPPKAQPQVFEIATPKATPKAKSEPKAKAKASLSLLRRVTAERAERPVPRGAIENTSTTTGSRESSGIENSMSEQDVPNLTNNELTVINEILGMTTERMRERLRALNKPSHGNRDTLINRLANARLNTPSAPVMAYIRRQRRRIDTP